jgi:hypothetical protein
VSALLPPLSLFFHIFLSFVLFIFLFLSGARGSWLRHYATSRKVAGSSPDEVDFFSLPNASTRTMALGSTQPLTETYR